MRGLVGHHAVLQRAAGRRLDAGIPADDGVEPASGVRVVDLEQPLHRGDHVLAGERLAVGEFDAFTQFERVGLAAVADRRHRLGEVGDDGVAVRASDLLESHQAVIGAALIQLPIFQLVVDLRVDGAGSTRCGQLQRAAAMLLHQRGAVGRVRGERQQRGKAGAQPEQAPGEQASGRHGVSFRWMMVNPGRETSRPRA